MQLESWDAILAHIDYAYQPIIDVNSGKIYAYEALIRGVQNAGFDSIDAFFDAAYNQSILYELDIVLRKMAIKKFVHFRMENEALFYNVDNRILDMPNYKQGNTKHILDEFDMPSEMLCYELSEKYKFKSYTNLQNIVSNYKLQGFKIALDDFGAGYSGIELLYHSDIDILKIDRFLASNINKDSKKRVVMGHIIKMAHALGIKVVAEGVETLEEFYACRGIGVDLMQGYFIQKPTTSIDELQAGHAESIASNIITNKRSMEKDVELIRERLERISPVSIDATINSIAMQIKNEDKFSIYPVINNIDIPVGLISERSLKKYFYSPYGKDVISYHKVRNYMSPCPILEIATPVETILDVFADCNNDAGGIIITQDGKYNGFLTPQSLLSIINEKNLRAAREQNPLTKLPGNILINNNISMAFDDIDNGYLLVYFDLNDFKPFNDKFGFRQGDRAILLFADILKEKIYSLGGFVGHIGGDDFYASFKIYDKTTEEIMENISYVIGKFGGAATTFYSADDKAKGYIISKDRFGVEKEFSLLSVSASCIILPKGTRELTQDKLSSMLADLKKEAKASVTKYVVTICDVKI